MADWKERHEVADSDDGDEDFDVAISEIGQRPVFSRGNDISWITATSSQAQHNTEALESAALLLERQEPSHLKGLSSPLFPVLYRDDDSEDELALPAPRSEHLERPDHAPFQNLPSGSSHFLDLPQSSHNYKRTEEEQLDRSEDQGAQQLDSPLSSPLTSLTSTPRETTPEIANESSQNPSTAIGHTGASVSVVVPANSDFLPDQPAAYAPLRSLRRRNAIQLNPYRVEDAIYRQLSRAAGLAPIRLNRQQPASEEETQEYVPPPEQESQPGRQSDTHADGRADIFEGDLQMEEPVTGNPVVPQSLLTHQDSLIGRRRKRRRLNDNRPTLNTSLNERNSTTPVAGRTLDPLLSPPSSGSSQDHPLPTKKSFRYPPGLTPPQLHTPAVSSETRSRRPIILSDETDANQQIPPNETTSPTSPNALRQDELSDTASESDQDVQLVKRKIKGVLPASWLRIDLKNQTKQPLPGRRSPEAASPTKTSRPGVARPIMRRKDRNTAPVDHRQPVFALLDDTSSEEENSSLRNPAAVHLDEANPLILVREADSDSMEEDFIDPMIPSVSRNSAPKKAGHRQHHRAGLFKRSRDQSAHYVQSKLSGHIRSSRRPRKSTPKVPNLGLLDVYDEAVQPNAPNFIKIALRATRQRRDKGRHSPSSKIMQLSTREQTAEVDETMSQWKRGAINQRALPTLKTIRHIRSPLDTVSGNERLLPRPRAQNYGKSSSQIQRKQTSLDDFSVHMSSAQSPQTDQKGRNSKAWSSNRRAERRIAPSLFNSSHALPAILEAPKRFSDALVEVRNTHRPPHRAGSHAPAAYTDSNPILQRFLDSARVEDQAPDVYSEHDHSRPIQPVQRQERSRKRQPKQELPSFYMPARFELRETTRTAEPVLEDDGDDTLEQCYGGLTSYESDYTIDFDVAKLPSWLNFQTSTLLNDGILTRVLNKDWSQELLVRKPAILVQLPDTSNDWGSWNETIVSDIDKLAAWVQLNYQESDEGISRGRSLTNAFDCMISYFLESISFLDSVDRRNCVCTVTCFLKGVTECFSMNTLHSQTDLLPVLCRMLLLSYANCSLARHSLIETHHKEESQKAHKRLLMMIAEWTFNGGISDLIQFQQCIANCSMDFSSAAARNKAEAIVILLHVSGTGAVNVAGFWDLLADTVPFQLLHTAKNASSFERKWFSLFSVLPFLNIGMDGKPSENPPAQHQCENWGYVGKLLAPFLQAGSKELYRKNFNVYCHSMFRRCYVLAMNWNWTQCEPILRVLYDFFAKNNLRNLPAETPRGHPLFLENPELTRLVPYDKDTAFHIFLKLVGIAILSNRETYSEKKVRSIVFRLTPNHGRSLPKHQAITQDDLEALRNHHNLLSMLYQVSPPPCRPRLDLIRQLIRVEDSHRQACHVSIRTWCELTLFHLRTGDSLSDIHSLAAWFDDTISQLVHQHSAARKEIEGYSSALSLDIQNSTIANNQTQVEAVISDALGSLIRVLSSSQDPKSLEVLVTPGLAKILELFDARTTRTNKVIEKALDSIQCFCDQAQKMAPSEDSQEYGDWSAFDELVATPTVYLRPSIPEPLQRALRGLVSNALGAGIDVGEAFMTTLLQTWTSLAHYQIESGTCSWTDFIDDYGRYSWHSFGESDQKTRYTGLYFAMIIDQDQSAYDAHKLMFLRSWIASLAEREAQIKYQGRLTSAILNRDFDNTLLDNPPFTRVGTPPLFQIDAFDLAERRLSLISCVLSNMWKSHQEAMQRSQHDAAEQKQEHSELLKTLMRTMKNNFIASGSGIARKGAYVDFVQGVVALMQQYTKDICPIDRFFTDSAQFPLPTHDPNYVVGRLKGYALRLSEKQFNKQLVAFVLSSVERAIIDEKRDYLIGQFQCSMLNAFGDGRQETNLLGFFARSIAPAFTSAALSTPCGWLFAAPLMEAFVEVFENIMYDVDSACRRTVDAAADSMIRVLSAIRTSLELLVDHPGHLEQPHIVRMLQLYYAVVCASVCPLDYCMRVDIIHWERAVPLIDFLRSFAAFAWGHLDGRPDVQAPLDESVQASASVEDSSYDYAVTGLNSTLATNWMKIGERYEMRSSAGTRTVNTDLESLEGESRVLAEQLVVFYQALQRLPSLGPPVKNASRSAWDVSLVIA